MFLIVAVGLAVGIAGALAAGRIVGSFLTVSAHDPVTYVFVTGVLAVVALAACFIPARRAMRVDPMVALRYSRPACACIGLLSGAKKPSVSATVRFRNNLSRNWSSWLIEAVLVFVNLL